ncbi:MAG: hypothetical protein JWR36_2816 [Glaciihabitans sp.]|nr:hypothetical protein [Glaciihabitans sp.]
MAAAASSLFPFPRGVENVVAALVIVALFSAVGIAFIVRSLRYSITLRPDDVHIRGFLWNRKIARAQITEITPSGWIRWTMNERRHLTPMTLFWSFGHGGFGFEEHAERGLAQVRKWVREGNPLQEEPPRHLLH